MLIGPGMKVAGSVSGGCIEGAVIEEALEVLETGQPRQLNYGVEDDLALSVGLSCGGEVSVLVEKHWAFSNDPETRKVWDTLQNCIFEQSAGCPAFSTEGAADSEKLEKKKMKSLYWYFLTKVNTLVAFKITGKKQPNLQWLPTVGVKTALLKLTEKIPSSRFFQGRTSC